MKVTLDKQVVVTLVLTGEEYNAIRDTLGNISTYQNTANGTEPEAAKLAERLYMQMEAVE